MQAPASTPVTTLGDIMRQPDFLEKLNTQRKLLIWAERDFHEVTTAIDDRHAAGTPDPEQDVVEIATNNENLIVLINKQRELDTEITTYLNSIRGNAWTSVAGYDGQRLAECMVTEPEEHFRRDVEGRVIYHNWAMHV